MLVNSIAAGSRCGKRSEVSTSLPQKNLLAAFAKADTTE
jgi:hypothetical protein